MNASAKEARLLLIDDDAFLRGMAVRTLRHAGFECAVASDGESGLAVLEREPVDLVLLDVMMPGIDGFEVCSRLRQQPGGDAIPVLMLTGLDDTESIEEAFRRGATDFVTKPINWALLVQRIRYSLRASHMAAAVVRQREQLDAGQRLAKMGSWEWKRDGDALACSREMRRILALDERGETGVTPGSLLARVVEADRPRVERARETLMQAGTPYEIQYSIDVGDGGCHSLFEQAAAERDAAGKIVGLQAVAQDITDRVEAEQRIRTLAFTDELTGLPNRQYFSDFALSAIQRAEHLGRSCALLHLDLDRFKSINDSLGHDGGDEVLKDIARRISGCVRSDEDRHRRAADERGREMVARAGANTFLVFLVDLGSDETAAVVSRRLLDAVVEPIVVAGHSLYLTASVGIAMYPRDAQEISGLLRAAEQAMYAAKAAGRACHCFFDEELNRSSHARVELEQEFRHALGVGELCLYFQPKVDASNGRLMGAETLVRWQHPVRGLLLPGEFIGVAEDAGLIVPMTDAVLNMACAAWQRWHRAGLPEVSLSVNVPGSYFTLPDAIDRVVALTRTFGVKPQMLTIEITESVLMSDREGTIECLQALKRQGFRLSLDDFGTGFSSLSYLHRFPIDELKIDRSFVLNMDKGGRDAIIANSVIALGEQFGLDVVAEGVETDAHVRELLLRGCAVHQGYYFSRPVPEACFVEILRDPTHFASTLLA
jgi:diguanylate cyclase (GGDEF)-like protein